MAEQTLSQEAADAILKRIIEWAPTINGTSALLNLAETYALVTGKVTSRGEQVTVNK